jgi:hypothetical protein
LTEDQPVTDDKRFWTSEPAFIAAGIVELSNVELDQLRYWTCRGLCWAVYAQDARGSVWLGLTVSTHATDRAVMRLDKLDEVEAVLEEVRDGDFLATLYDAGLRDDLIPLFLS